MFTFLKRLVILAVVVLSIYSGYKFAMPYYRYYAFKTDAADIIKFRVREVEQMRAKLLQRALDIGVPITAKEIVVEPTDRGYWTLIKWSEEVNILNQYKKTLKFEIELEKK